MHYRNFLIGTALAIAASALFLVAQERGMQREEMPMERERPMMQGRGMMGMMGMMRECMRLCDEVNDVSDEQVEELREARESNDPEELRAAIDQAIAAFEETGSHMERCTKMMRGGREPEERRRGMMRQRQDGGRMRQQGP